MRTSTFFFKNLTRQVVLFAAVAVATSTMGAIGLGRVLSQEFTSKGIAISKSVASSGVELLLEADASIIQSTINQYLDINGVGYVFVVDPNGEIISHTFVPEVPIEVTSFLGELYSSFDTRKEINSLESATLGQHIDINASILGGVAGYVHVGMDRAVIVATIRERVYEQLAVVFVMFLIAIVVAYISSRRIAQPVVALTDFSTRVSDLDFSATVSINTGDELEILAGTMTKMKNDLKGAYEEIERTLSDIMTVDHMADGLILTDPDGIITRCNPRLHQMLELNPDSVVGKSSDSLLSLSLVAQFGDKEVKGSDTITAEVTLPHARVGKATATPVVRTGEGGTDAAVPSTECLGYVVCIRDITQEKEMEVLKTQFVSTISHELRTPLTSIVGFASIIETWICDISDSLTADADPKLVKKLPKILESLGIIVDEGHRMTSIVSDLLDVMKMESGRMDWDMQPIDLGDVVKCSFAKTEGLFEGHPITPMVDVDETLPKILADREKLMQVTINFISNAAKFTEQGTVTGRAFRDGDRLIVSVTDEGRGISQVDQEKVFQRFRQVGDAMTDKPAGSGLGLAICKEIIEHHDGRIWVESEVNVGSTFSFSIPIERTADTTQDNELPDAEEELCAH